tara:strand:- start:1093 stop:1455 length:363 start_codon:yes stop_codon:yes gene_type:complete
MKISKQRLVEIIEEECDMAQDPHSSYSMDGIDKEGKMAKRQLHDMEKYARELSEMLQDTTQLESWVQAKLTKAADYLKTVKHYVEYGMEEGAYDQVMPETEPMQEPYEIDDSEMIKIMRE